MRHHKNFLAHDELESCVLGDVVRINACEKISKRKHFTLGEVVIPAARFTDDQGKLHTQQGPGFDKRSLYAQFQKQDETLLPLPDKFTERI